MQCAFDVAEPAYRLECSRRGGEAPLMVAAMDLPGAGPRRRISSLTRKARDAIALVTGPDHGGNSRPG
jgi:hypothetical protein